MRICTTMAILMILAIPGHSLQAKVATARAVESSRWALLQIGSSKVTGKPSSVAVIGFGNDHLVSGTWACNSFGSGDIRWTMDSSRNSGTFEPYRNPARPSIITAVGCPNRMADSFWKRMLKGGRWSIVNNRLTVTFTDGVVAKLKPE